MACSADHKKALDRGSSYPTGIFTAA